MKAGRTKREDPRSRAECGAGLSSGMGLALVALRHSGLQGGGLSQQMQTQDAQANSEFR